MAGEKCENCRFVGKHRVLTMGGRSESDLPVCRRNPPVFHTEYSFDKPGTISGFPRVDSEDWCGSYEPQQPA